MSLQTLSVGAFTFQLRYSRRRKTVGLTIERDGQLTITAPHNCPLDLIEQVARQKQVWVYGKLAAREQLFQPRQPKEYVPGEGFYYLGCSYRLKLITPDDETVPPLRLHQGRFQLRRDALDQAEQHFINWYTTHGQPWIARRASLFTERLGVTPASIEVRTLGYRWGSCGRGRRLYFHWRAICLPPRIIEYVIVHELAHLLEPHHGPAFWRRLERVIPDFAARKTWLAEHGGRY